MKFLTQLVLLCCLSALALGQNAPSQPQPQEPPPPSAPPAAREPDTQPPNEAVQQAESLLNEVAAAYKNAPTITDTMQVKVETAQTEGMQPPEPQELKIKLGQGSDAQISTEGMKMTALDGQLYIEQAQSPNQYMRAPLQGDLATTLELLQGGEAGLPPHFALRAERGVDEYVEGLTLGLLGPTKLTGHHMVRDEAGDPVHEVTFQGQLGDGSAQIDPDTKLLSKVTINISPNGTKLGTATITMDPKIADTLDEPIAFEPGDRRAVDLTVPVQPGQPAPDFTLKTLDGEQVTLSELRGNVVVLDFWATWCPPCVRGLPMLSEFADWAASSGHPIKVYAVNVMERIEAPQRPEKVREFWSARDFTMPTLIDIDDEVVKKYGFTSIPTTVIVGPDGMIAQVHTGLRPDMAQELKNDSLKALGQPIPAEGESPSSESQPQSGPIEPDDDGASPQ